MTDPRTILARAADELETRGWQTIGYGTAGGCKCAWGALYYAAWTDGGHTEDELVESGLTEDPEMDESLLCGVEIDAAEAAAELLAHHLGLPDYVLRLADWNDAHTTAGPVIAAMRAAAEVEVTGPVGKASDRDKTGVDTAVNPSAVPIGLDLKPSPHTSQALAYGQRFTR